VIPSAVLTVEIFFLKMKRDIVFVTIADLDERRKTMIKTVAEQNLKLGDTIRVTRDGKTFLAKFLNFAEALPCVFYCKGDPSELKRVGDNVVAPCAAQGEYEILS